MSAPPTVSVPFLDLALQYGTIQNEVTTRISRVCNTADFILGREVTEFENAFAAFTGAKWCVGVANGTDALELAFRALGIGAGDEVIIPAHTFVATAIGVMRAGARPVLVDVDAETLLIDPERVEAAITQRTRALCPVHLYGRLCELRALGEIAEKHKLLIVEDAAQAHGANHCGLSAGTFGDVGCFSFYPGKNLGGYGDGGAIVTSSDSINRKVRQLRNYGSEQKYHHPVFGVNSRLDSIQAAVLNVKLPKLSRWNDARRAAAAIYTRELTALGFGAVKLPQVPIEPSHVFHLYVVRHVARDIILAALRESRVHCGVHYPKPFYLQDGFASLGYQQGDFPNTEAACASVLSLPIFPEISERQINYVIEQIVRVLRAL